LREVSVDVFPFKSQYQKGHRKKDTRCGLSLPKSAQHVRSPNPKEHDRDCQEQFNKHAYPHIESFRLSRPNGLYCGAMPKPKTDDKALLVRVAHEHSEALEADFDATAMDDLIGRLIKTPPAPKQKKTKRRKRGITKTRPQ
jgi:hypothetical protein